MITAWQQQTHAHLTLILQHFLQSPWGGENIDYIRQSQQGEEECELKLQSLMVWNVRAKEEYCFPTEVERKFVPLHYNIFKLKKSNIKLVFVTAVSETSADAEGGVLHPAAQLLITIKNRLLWATKSAQLQKQPLGSVTKIGRGKNRLTFSVCQPQ